MTKHLLILLSRAQFAIKKTTTTTTKRLLFVSVGVKAITLLTIVLFKSVIVKHISSSTRNQYKDRLPGGAVVYSIVMAG